MPPDPSSRCLDIRLGVPVGSLCAGVYVGVGTPSDGGDFLCDYLGSFWVVMSSPTSYLISDFDITTVKKLGFLGFVAAIIWLR